MPDVDVASLWSVGRGLAEFVRAFDETTTSKTITEKLEPEALGDSRALVRDHTAFIPGFSTGQQLMARSNALREANREMLELRHSTEEFFKAAIAMKNLLADRAKRLTDTSGPNQ